MPVTVSQLAIAPVKGMRLQPGGCAMRVTRRADAGMADELLGS